MKKNPDENVTARLRVLAVCAYPVEAAATRFRVVQHAELLRKRGIDLTVKPLIEGPQFAGMYKSGSVAHKAIGLTRPILRRLFDSVKLSKFDILFVQREAMMFGPGVFEWLYSKIGRLPMVLDLDDATYVRYVSPTYGRIGSFLKFMGKTDNLIKRSKLVVCGNRFIADYVEDKGTRAIVVPTVVDPEEFRPREITPNNATPILGWIGTHSTFPFLESILPVLGDLAKKYKFRLKVIGSGRKTLEVSGVDVELSEWSLEREVGDFKSIDIGLYPITTSSSASEEWIKGKSGFKAVQYMAVGIPFVMSPVGICAEIGEPGLTHFNADTQEDWYNSLNRLLSDAGLRAEMGSAGRKHAVENYDLDSHAEKLAEALKSVARR